MSSNLDPKLVYHPPCTLQFPAGMEPKPKVESRPDSPNSSNSSSRSDLSSPSFNRDSEFEFPGKLKSEIIASKEDNNKTDGRTGGGSFENESDSNSTTTAKTILSGQTSKENLASTEADRRNSSRLPKTPVSKNRILYQQ